MEKLLVEVIFHTSPQPIPYPMAGPFMGFIIDNQICDQESSASKGMTFVSLLNFSSFRLEKG